MILFIMSLNFKILLLVLSLEFNCLQYIYGLPEMNKISSGTRFIIADKKCINKQLSKHVTSAFRLCYSQIDTYHQKKYYFSGTKTFW